MSAAGQYSILADQGATFTLHIVYEDSTGTPINLTGYTARMALRDRVGSSDVALSLTTENGRIALGGVAGTVDLTVTAAAMTLTGTYVYDLELVSGLTVTRILMGDFVIRPEVTR
jgi:hypothetical protein